MALNRTCWDYRWSSSVGIASCAVAGVINKEMAERCLVPPAASLAGALAADVAFVHLDEKTRLEFLSPTALSGLAPSRQLVVVLSREDIPADDFPNITPRVGTECPRRIVFRRNAQPIRGQQTAEWENFLSTVDFDSPIETFPRAFQTEEPLRLFACAVLLQGWILRGDSVLKSWRAAGVDETASWQEYWAPTVAGLPRAEDLEGALKKELSSLGSASAATLATGLAQLRTKFFSPSASGTQKEILEELLGVLDTLWVKSART